MRWDNPVSKAHGQITPIGFAFPSNDLICRKFSARFDTAAGDRVEEGSACRDKNAEWKIAELQPAKAGPQPVKAEPQQAKAEAPPLREAVLSPK